MRPRLLLAVAALAWWAIPCAAQYGRRYDPRYDPYGAPQQNPQGPDVLATFSGTVRGIDGKGMTIEGDDTNAVAFRFTHKTVFLAGQKKIKASDIHADDRVAVEAKKAPDGSLDAVVVHLDRDDAKKS